MNYYILIEPWGVYVKEAEFFKSQGGLTQEWGKNWKLIEAESIEDARRKGWDINNGHNTISKD